MTENVLEVIIFFLALVPLRGFSREYIGLEVTLSLLARHLPLSNGVREKVNELV